MNILLFSLLAASLASIALFVAMTLNNSAAGEPAKIPAANSNLDRHKGRRRGAAP